MKKFMKLVAISMVVSLLASCGAAAKPSPSAPPASVAPTGTAPAATAPSGKNVTLRFSWWGDDKRHKATLDAIELFKKKVNPNVTIEGEYGGFDGYLEKTITQLAANSAPDIMQIDYAFLEPFWGQMNNFVDFKAQTTVKMDGFSESLLKGISAPGGELIGLPTGLNASALFANKVLAEKIGIDLTKQFTWDKVFEDAKKVRSYNKEMYLAYPTTMNRYFFEPYLFNLTGKPLVNPDYTLGFTKADLVKTFEFTKRLFDEEVIQPLDEITSIKTPVENPRWLNDQVIFMPDLLSGFTGITASKPANTVAILAPMGDPNAANTGIILRPTNMLAAYAKSKNSAEALSFINFFFNDEEAIQTLGLVRSVPSTSQGLTLMAKSGQLNEGLKNIADWAGTHKGGAGQNIISTNTELEKIETDMISRFYYDKISPEKAADEFMSYMTDKVGELKVNAAKK